MAKQEEKLTFMQKLMKYRKVIFLSLFGLLMPIMFITIFYTSSYNANKPNPFSDITYTKSSLEEINDTKFKIEKYYIKLFYAQTAVDENGNQEDLGEGDGGKITFSIDLGAVVDRNIVGNSIAVNTYACYNWVNYTSGKGSITNLEIGSKERTWNISNFVTDWNKNPFFLVYIKIKDVKFHTSFTWTENISGVETKVTYVVVNTYKDLITSDTLFK